MQPTTPKPKAQSAEIINCSKRFVLVDLPNDLVRERERENLRKRSLRPRMMNLTATKPPRSQARSPKSSNLITWDWTLRQLLTEYYVRPVLLERAARAIREVRVPENVIHPIRCLKSIQSARDADGKWRCHKCARFLNHPKKFTATFVSAHSLEHHKWVYISPLVPYSLMSFTAIMSSQPGMTSRLKCLYQTPTLFRFVLLWYSTA